MFQTGWMLLTKTEARYCPRLWKRSYRPDLSECVNLHSLISSIVDVSDLHFTAVFEVANNLCPPPCPIQAWSSTNNTNCKEEEHREERLSINRLLENSTSRVSSTAQLFTKTQQHCLRCFYFLSTPLTSPTDKACR